MVTLEDGTKYTGDLIIGADGMHVRTISFVEFMSSILNCSTSLGVLAVSSVDLPRRKAQGRTAFASLSLSLR